MSKALFEVQFTRELHSHVYEFNGNALCNERGEEMMILPDVNAARKYLRENCAYTFLCEVVTE